MKQITMKENCAVLSIAGSDSGGGAGIQADLKTFSALGVFGTSVITAVTAQNLSGVSAIQAVVPDVVEKQLLAVLEGFPIKAIKTGMLFSAEIIGVIVAVLSAFPSIPLVTDPVFAATSGSRLIEDDAVAMLTEKLFPLASLITPNMPEAEVLSGLSLSRRDQLPEAAVLLHQRFGTAVLLKGGHLEDHAVDVLCDDSGVTVFESPLIGGVNNHGSGCTLAAAIAAALARGELLTDAVSTAKSYINDCLNQALRLSDELLVINHFPFSG